MHEIQRIVGKIEANLDSILEKLAKQEEAHEEMDRRVSNIESKINIAAGVVLTATTAASIFGQTILKKLGII